MSEFVAGLSARQGTAGIAEALQRAFAPPIAFAARAVGLRDDAPIVEPRHFSPAEPGHRPTEGWDPFDAAQDLTAKPFVDPVAAAHEAGYAEGFAAARAEADTAAQAHAALLQQVSDALASGAHFDRERMAGHLRQTVLHLVTRMIGEAGVAPDVLAGRIEAATDMLADSAESAILRLHPDDVALVEGKLPKTVFPIADPAVQRGGFLIESASTIVEDGPDLWLEQLAAAIDRVPIPPIV
ncbi:FliH/SctL family protein [Sphingomonas turrisvirgatae]|uniref:Flagellar assembly protein FliH n=1 Tax=Sphingomonas turrisvirgatae TaxID=1888892 RepID=A0A1E3LWV7_9SPHN|nr:FliH/SctL family protein [Sphingomonas turrisvirgatae]ODP37625.1 flagellar biosynthesis protein FliH [Sphingomonas turrisvirgatae]